LVAPAMSGGCQPAVDRARLGLRPRNFEILAAPPAGHAAGPSGERLPLTAARADGVTIVAAPGEVHGVVWPGHNGPPAGRSLDDLQECRRDFQKATTDLENRLKRIEPRDAVPRPAAELHVQVGPQASPHPSHRLTPVRIAPHCFAQATPSVKPPRRVESRQADRPLTLAAQPSAASSRLICRRPGDAVP